MTAARRVDRSAGTGALELELRQLTGVRLVALGRSGDATLVELEAEDGINEERLRHDARRVTLGHVDGPVVIELIGDPPATGAHLDGRVRLVLTQLPGGPLTGVRLAYRDRQVILDASAEDRLPLATEVIDGLRRLGFAVSHQLVGAHALPEELGAGTLVVLTDPLTGEQRQGVAPGASTAEATARAVLAALNRSLRMPVAAVAVS